MQVNQLEPKTYISGQEHTVVQLAGDLLTFTAGEVTQYNP